MVRRTDRIQLYYELGFSTPFHCGTGLRVGLIDRTIVRDHDGYLYVPGSSMKGCIREHCERMSRLFEELDDNMRDNIASPHDMERSLLAMGQPLTMVSRIFGNHRSPGRLYFEDARQSEEERNWLTRDNEARRDNMLQASQYTQVRIDRLSQTFVPGALYTSEFGIKNVVLTGRISGWLRCTPIEEIEDGPTFSLLLLLAGLHLIDRVGGNRSTGKGQCQVSVIDLKINGQTCLEESWKAWFDHLDQLSLYSYVEQNQEDDDE